MKKSGVFVMLLLMISAVWVFLVSRPQPEGQYQQGQEQAASKGESTVPAAPMLSAGSGFYEEEFELYITAPEGAAVYYTLDGSRPGLDSILYTEPVTVSYGGGRDSGQTIVRNAQNDWMDKEAESHLNVATVIRAFCVNEAGEASDIVTATYFIGANDYKDKLVVSLVADPEDLFGENGIYVTGKAYDDWYLGDQSGDEPVPNFMQHGEAWERPAVLEVFQGESLLQQPVGIRIQGASARRAANKRFSVYSRKKYSGSAWFGVLLFGEGRTHSFVLRSGFMNGYIQHLIRDRNVASAESMEATVYLNGAMWYVTFVQEKYSEKYFQEKYGVVDDNVVIVKAGEADSGLAEDQALYQAIYDFLDTNDMSSPEAYEQFNQIVDIQSYIDFSCVNVYFANLDYNESKNVVCWRVREPGAGEYEDGRWRWGLYDMDLDNGDYGVAVEDINTFTTDTHYAGGAFNTRPMYAALKRNPEFCRQFVLSLMDMVNTDFTVERAAEAMGDWDVTTACWGVPDDWTEVYFPARTESVKGHLAEEFGLKGTCEEVRLSVSDREGGFIILNTIAPVLTEDGWSGSYFTDYPVTVTAVAGSGYSFAGWQSDDLPEEYLDQETLVVEIPSGGLTLKAVFEKNDL